MCIAERIQFGVIHPVTVPKGDISVEGKEAIWLWLRQNTESFFLPDDWVWSADVRGKGEYVGSFAKRVSKYAHKNGVKLSSDAMGKLGSLVGQYTMSESVYHIDYTKDFDWQAGDFGDSGSCFWGRRSGAKKMILGDGGFAVRCYENGRGSGRAWIIPHYDCLVVFNAYGITLESIARILAIDLRQSYKKVEVANRGNNDGTLWINRGTGYMIGSIDHFTSSVDFQIEEIGNSTCKWCRATIDEDDAISIGDAWYCEHCVAEHFIVCHRCGEYFHNNYVYEVSGECYCESCRDVVASRCSDCHDWFLDGDMTEAGGDLICDGCLSEHYQQCDHCGEWYANEVCEDLDGGVCCVDCRESLPSCSKCGNAAVPSFTIEGEVHCKPCRESQFEYSPELGEWIRKGQLCLV